jgi:hypothetical protein
MNLTDVRLFVDRNRGRLLPSVAENSTFQVDRTESALIFTIKSGKKRNESFAWLEQSLAIFNRTGSLNKNDYGHSHNTTYVLGLFWAIVRESVDWDELLPTEEKEILSAPPTEQLALRKSRLGQGRYRDDLLQLRKRCYVTGLAHTEVLRASHIKPWSKSDNRERLDCRNGLLLCPNFDTLFDKGFITFEDDGHIRISPALPREIMAAFGVDPAFYGSDLGAETKAYLAYHREHRFKPA